jgi:uncharacterized membrane protein YedE/YeeE
MTRNPLYAATTIVAGLIFGVGLTISGMIDPKKVKDFLDFAAIPSGGWDPSLAFVMGGAVIVAFFFYRFAGSKPVAAERYHPATYKQIDARLLGGAAIFGVGWGLSGLCPGPAIADLAIVPRDVILFIAAMAAGSWATGLYLGRSRRRDLPLGNAPAE